MHYDRLGRPAAEALEAAARKAAEKVTLEINALAIRLVNEQDQTSRPALTTRRVNFGVYLYVEDEPPPEAGP